MENRWKTRSKSLQGVASSLRRKLLLGFFVTLGLSGLTFFIMNIVPVEKEISIESLFLGWLATLIGFYAGYIFILRWVMPSLKSLNYVEKSIASFGDSETPQETEELISEEIKSDSLLQAYFAMLKQVEAREDDQVELLSKIVHEVRSPLASILGYAELLSDPELRHDEEYLDTCRRVIVKQTQHISDYVEQMLCLASAEAKIKTMKMAPFNLPRLVEAVVQDIQRYALRGIDYDNQVGEVMVFGDILRMREALLNLINDGIENTPADTPLRVAVAKAAEPGWVDITIDNFNPLSIESGQEVYVKALEAPAVAGNGQHKREKLGLTIAQNIIQHHKGEIAIRSKN
ncbi:MAG: HAMP domain-containing sensor histidine kinase, partial [Anaerolineales bacterium]